MQTILIAQQQAQFAEALAAPLRSAGYRAITCPGPWPPALRCIRCDVGYCPLTEAADLLIYDPELVGYDADGGAHRLAVESARSQPDAPLLLAWPGEAEPAGVAAIQREVPRAAPAARAPRELVEQVVELVATAG